MFSKLIFFQLFNTFLICTDAKVAKPEIFIEYIRYSDSDTWTSVNCDNAGSVYKRNGDDFTILQSIVSLTFVCKASYPVYWDVQLDWQSKATMANDILTVLERQVPDDKFHDISTYTFSTSIILQMLYKQLSGNYTCMSALNSKVKKTTYIYFENVQPPLLVKAENTVNVSIENKDTILLPCQVYDPDAVVYLSRQTEIIQQNGSASSWEDIPLNNSVTFDPKAGFSLKVRDFPNILGSYKCMTNFTDDFVNININRENVDELQTESESNIISEGATYYWNSTNNRFYCCTKGMSPPKMILNNCQNQPSCNLKRKAVSITKNNETDFEPNCTKNCSCAWLLEDESYVISCEGKSISLLSDLYSSVNLSAVANGTTKPPPYYPFRDFNIHTQWDPLSMNNQPTIQILPYPEFNEDGSRKTKRIGEEDILIENGRPVFYVGETVTFDCYTAEYFLSHGNIWAYKLKNGTSIFLYNVTKAWEKYYGGDQIFPYWREEKEISIFSMQLFITEEMDSVLCYAPVWNSSDWILASLPFEAREPTYPGIEGRAVETYHWNVKDTEMFLYCETSLILPDPTYTWTKDGKELSTDETYIVLKEIGYTILLIRAEVSPKIQGQYICSATNIAGTAARTFNIVVTGRNTLALVIGGLIVILIFMVAIASFIRWKREVGEAPPPAQQSPTPSARNHTMAHQNSTL